MVSFVKGKHFEIKNLVYKLERIYLTEFKLNLKESQQCLFLCCCLNSINISVWNKNSPSSRTKSSAISIHNENSKKRHHQGIKRLTSHLPFRAVCWSSWNGGELKEQKVKKQKAARGWNEKIQRQSGSFVIQILSARKSCVNKQHADNGE